jgi:predicted adenine nucleotide alpha hydrolase (AANH) superfamily ATPase
MVASEGERMTDCFERMERVLAKLREAGEKIVGEALEPTPHKKKRQKKTRYVRR